MGDCSRLSLRLIASIAPCVAGDGLQAPHGLPHVRVARCAGERQARAGAMSHESIAATFALEGLSIGERLVAYSLASFANGEHQAWPGTSSAAARAGLSRSQYLAARRGLERRGLVEVVAAGGGRGRSSVVALRFAEHAAADERRINPRLFEAVLSYSRARGPARLLLAALGALADDDRVASGISTEALCAAAGVSDRTYRRARAELLRRRVAPDADARRAGQGRARRRPGHADRRVLATPTADRRRRAAPSGGVRR